MKISTLTATALVAGASASPVARLESRTLLESDVLVAEGVFKLGLEVALNGYPDPEKCTLDNVAIRREW